MKMILFVGIPASGKSTFYRERFFGTHIRINLDMLKTRLREKLLIDACLAAKQPFVVDNTNPSKNDRLRYISAAKEAGFAIDGYFFETLLEDALRRNASRKGNERIANQGVIISYARLEIPSLDEGFDRLFSLKLSEKAGFQVKTIE